MIKDAMRRASLKMNQRGLLRLSLCLQFPLFLFSRPALNISDSLAQMTPSRADRGQRPDTFFPRVHSSAVGNAVGWGEVVCQIRLTQQYNNNEAQPLMSSRHAEHGLWIGVVLFCFSDHVCNHLQNFHHIFTFTLDFINPLTNFKNGSLP